MKVSVGKRILMLIENSTYPVDLRVRHEAVCLQGHKESHPVVINDDVWLGARVIVLPGIRIGNRSVIGAGVVVTKEVSPFAICAGNPARRIRFRNDAK